MNRMAMKNKYSRLSLSRSQRDPLKHFEISVFRHIRFAELRKIPIKQPKFTNEQFLLFSTIFSYLMLYFYVERRIRLSLRDKGLFEINEVEITRVDCKSIPFHNFLARL